MNNSIQQKLGLCQRAGKLLSGEEAVLAAVRKGEAKLVLLSHDASANTAKRIQDKCLFHRVPCRIVGNRQELGAAIGKAERVVVGITDPGLAQMVDKQLKIFGGEGDGKGAGL